MTSGGERTPPLHANTKKNIFFSEIATKKREENNGPQQSTRNWLESGSFYRKSAVGWFFFEKKRLNTLLIYFDFFWSVSFIIHRIFFCYRALSGIAGPFFLFLNKFFGKNFRNEPLTAFIDSLDARKRKKKMMSHEATISFFFLLIFAFLIQSNCDSLFFFKLDAGKEGSVRSR